MKNRLVFSLSICLILISTSVFSQVSPYLIGIESGLGISGLRSSVSDEIRVGFTEAVSGQYVFSDLLTLKTGIGYELKGSSGVIPLEGNPAGEGRYYQNFHFLTIPVLAKVTLGKKMKFFRNEIRYFANAGPYLSFLLKQNYKLAATEYSAEMKTNNTANYKKVEFGLCLGAGLAYSLYKDLDITFELRDNLGLNNINQGTQFNGGSVKTNAAYVIVGMVFQL